MSNAVYHNLALMLVPGLGPVQIRNLLTHFESAQDILQASKKELSFVENIGVQTVEAIKSFDNYASVEQEMDFIEKYHIDVISILDDAYPWRLKNCYDPPFLLFKKGSFELNPIKTVSIIGTRKASSYGRKTTEEICAGLKALNVQVISGLATGIDAIAHRAATQNGIANIGVLGNGLATIYPAEHKKLVLDMLEVGGGLLSEFTHKTKPDKFNFPRRNRVVAGLSDVVIIVESAAKGGSLITVQLALDYNRDVFAVPGRLNDVYSAGCNQLIADNKAYMYTDFSTFLSTMGWVDVKQKKVVQRSLFANINAEEMQIVDILKEKDKVFVDDLISISNMSNSQLAGVLLSLELNGVIQCLPGKFYALA